MPIGHVLLSAVAAEMSAAAQNPNEYDRRSTGLTRGGAERGRSGRAETLLVGFRRAHCGSPYADGKCGEGRSSVPGMPPAGRAAGEQPGTSSGPTPTSGVPAPRAEIAGTGPMGC
jgi:hypothetical protein